MDRNAAFEAVRKYVDFLRQQNYDVQSAYIFGSYASGEIRKDSDIDLALFIRGLKNSFITQVELMKLRRQFDIRIEPHPFFEEDFVTPTPFASEIITTGIRIM